MRLGVVADIHGNDVALRAVIADGTAVGVDAWWALGDLVLFGPRPVEVMELLADLPDVQFVAGNTDRYVITGEQPDPHATPEHAAGDVELVMRYGAMAGAIGWTRGALSQAGVLDMLRGLPSQQRLVADDDTSILGIHASLARDDGPGIDNRLADDDLASLLVGCDAATVVGGHTHDPTDRIVGDIRALNAGSVGLPRVPGSASWLVIDSSSPLRVSHRTVTFDAAAVVRDLHTRGYPNAGFVESVLTGQHRFGS